MNELFPLETSVAVITGTHSSGKSTLLSNLEQGKLLDLGVRDSEYDDFGYGVIESPTGPRPLITVPETARWFANVFNRPDMLAENYTLDFQLSIDALVNFRIHAATGLSNVVRNRMVDRNILPKDASMYPIVLSDRGPLDGVIYSEERIADRDTNIVDGSPRTGFQTEWLRSFVDLVIVSDHTEVAFETDEARLADQDMRERIAQSVIRNYTNLMPEGSVQVIKGTEEERKTQTIQLLSPLSLNGKLGRVSLPYSKWSEIKIS